LADRYVVEIEAHPVNPDEYALLNGGETNRLLERVELKTFSRL